MDGIRIPSGWRKPRMRVYEYNQEFGGSYYQPMISYIDDKDKQGIYFERPAEQIHLPDPIEISRKKHTEGLDTTGGMNVKNFLTKAYAQQIREQNVATAKTKLKTLNVLTARKELPHSLVNNQQTFFNDIRLLKGEVPGRKQVNYYTSMLGVSKVGEEWRDHSFLNHLTNVKSGRFSWELSDLGLGGTPSGEKFLKPNLMEDVCRAIQ